MNNGREYESRKKRQVGTKLCVWYAYAFVVAFQDIEPFRLLFI